MLTNDQKINVIAPALRAICAGDGLSPLAAFSSDMAAGAVEFDSTADSVETLVADLKKCVDSAGKFDALNVAGLGSFTLSSLSGLTGRVAGKVAVVTGAAQGFGLEIAQSLAAEGACVVLADINISGAAAAADQLCSQYGDSRAMAVEINVTDAASVAGAVSAVVKKFGGIDLFVANAGVLKAGSVKDLAEKDFDFVTAVNYKGYFLCTQAVAPVMAVAHAADSRRMSDIIQINSKSGLEGSNRNGAYAGSKFGGLGLTQSFAMELVTDGIKVNSVCPGNFFDGPLWSDPDRGLFVQYLGTGKVPGAKTIADVKKFYEAKVPMGRGCTTPDVMKAVLYLVDQHYETGQAVPVTGGQVMLK